MTRRLQRYKCLGCVRTFNALTATPLARLRHRLLEAKRQPKCRALAGIVEADETFILESFKVPRNLPQHPRKRGGKAGKPGLSAEQIPILIARDRHGEHVHEKVLHIQNVNSYMSRFKAWIRSFNGVATKYLQNYLGWRRMLEKSGGKLSPENCLAAAIG